MIDLNRLKNYGKCCEGVSENEQFLKVREEFKEVNKDYFIIKKFEYHYKKLKYIPNYFLEIKQKTKENCILEILDLITASYQLAIKLGLDDAHIDKHCEKMDSYIAKGGKYNP